MKGRTRITKKEFYALGGFSNPRCVRVDYGTFYAYFLRND